MKDLAVKLTNLTKTYQLHHEKPTLVERIFKGNYYERFTALDNLNLEIEKGEKIGLVGNNGSGKTTLLKIISGITTPTKGKVKTWGKLVSLIDLSAGFHPELTGRENVYLNGLIIGMSRKEVKDKYEEIKAFADIGDFIDAPMYTYSEGMKLRLGFSVAIAADPEILILDEGIGAGDENFRRKGAKKIDELFKRDKTIIVASHWSDFLKDNCKRFIWLDKKNVRADGGLDVLEEYRNAKG